MLESLSICNIKSRMKTRYYYISFLFLFLINGCDFINPSESIPSYIYVPDFKVVTSLSQGTNSNKITDVWVTVGNEFQGVYSLPALISVLAVGEQTVVLEAGIKDNGISAKGRVYNFYQNFQSKINLASNEVDTLLPTISYRAETRFAFIENFEQSTHLFRDLRIGDDFNKIQITREGAFEGNAGVFMLDKNNPTVAIATLNTYNNLTTKSAAVYLEVNYKSEVDVIFGVVGYKNGMALNTLYDPGFVARADWNKIYFNISSLVAGSSYDAYKIILQSALPSQNNIFTKDKASVWLDNIKLVHF